MAEYNDSDLRPFIQRPQERHKPNRYDRRLTHLTWSTENFNTSDNVDLGTTSRRRCRSRVRFPSTWRQMERNSAACIPQIYKNGSIYQVGPCDWRS